MRNQFLLKHVCDDLASFKSELQTCWLIARALICFTTGSMVASFVLILLRTPQEVQVVVVMEAVATLLVVATVEAMAVLPKAMAEDMEAGTTVDMAREVATV